jgi:hypothetical protein
MQTFVMFRVVDGTCLAGIVTESDFGRRLTEPPRGN